MQTEDGGFSLSLCRCGLAVPCTMQRPLCHSGTGWEDSLFHAVWLSRFMDRKLSRDAGRQEDGNNVLGLQTKQGVVQQLCMAGARCQHRGIWCLPPLHTAWPALGLLCTCVLPLILLNGWLIVKSQQVKSRCSLVFERTLQKAPELLLGYHEVQ